jgi:ferritin-like metal-binding protein YciE
MPSTVTRIARKQRGSERHQSARRRAALECLQETLVEEENTDEVLSELAEDAINPAAAA